MLSVAQHVYTDHDAEISQRSQMHMQCVLVSLYLHIRIIPNILADRSLQHLKV